MEYEVRVPTDAEVARCVQYYSEKKLEDHLQHGWLAKASFTVLRPLFTLWAILHHTDTPIWAKQMIVAALGYVLFPFDAIPDFIPIVGNLDDIAVMLSVLKKLSAYNTETIQQVAELKLEALLQKGSKWWQAADDARARSVQRAKGFLKSRTK
jgi:uncharacterized membrane protein YkvA (DUF1232 family)